MKLRKKNRRLLGDERALARAERVIRLQRQGWYAYLAHHLTYQRRVSPDERVTVAVETYDDLCAFYRHEGRMIRDNRKVCSCMHCGNPRHTWDYKNSWKSRTLAENRAYIAFVQSMRDADAPLPDGRWRAWRVRV